MKRIKQMILLLMLLALVGCGAKTWQEHYELGMKYLMESKYEKAILSFTAAIEIDPKRADAYIGRGDAYLALEDYEKALEDYEKAEELGAENMDEKKNAVLLNEYGETRFELRDEFVPYEECSAEEKNLIDSVMAAALAEDSECVREIMKNLNSDEWRLYTYKDGYKMNLDKKPNRVSFGDPVAVDTLEVDFEMRPENGTGYFYSITIGDNQDVSYDSFYKASGECMDWQWNGMISAKSNERRFFPDEWSPLMLTCSSTSTGLVKNNLREGETVQKTIVDFDKLNNNEPYIGRYTSTAIFTNGTTYKVTEEQTDQFLRTQQVRDVEFNKDGVETDLMYTYRGDGLTKEFCW